ncbi:MAG: rhamnogalacturonate lyase, partial [Prevotella sp.]|nr:rhamnogalacturonate lyase [Prevotella sp.]
MDKRFLFLAIFLLTITLGIQAQRRTDKLDRGLIAVQTDNGVFCSWRILGEEYYDVTYNLYRDGAKVAENLTASNFVDANGAAGSKYQVEAVVRGVVQTKSKEVTPWTQRYLEITPTHEGLKSTYVPNDACCADVDGDGVLEILMKYDNQTEISQSYPKNGAKVDGVDTKEYSLFECLKMDGTRLWYVNCGPNMGDFQNNEQNIVAYDWDQDGKAEAVMRAADGTTIHMANGETYVIGDATKNYRAATGGGTNWFMHDGAEYLVYMNGETGEPYQVMEYPLKRLEDGETSLEAAWGDGYGHRSSKHFFGAPYLDGRKPSIFLARGIYTRHKMIALDVNPSTHELTVRWRWNCSSAGSPWYGQGYHNFAVADVDWDGRDEICFGAMVIDDNGKGLSTTGFGHGDAQHHGDFNPYVHGHEIFVCMEDNPGNNYRDATTSKVYYRFVAGEDDGRCIAGNFSNDYPGAMAFSSRDTSPISCVTNNHVSGLEKGTIPDNMRIYWDGDLCEEGFNSTNGKNTAGGIYKYGKGVIETLQGSMTNNDTKSTPCYLGDLFGDWREEVIMRTKDNKIRIYTTVIPTEWRNYTLWHDM